MTFANSPEEGQDQNQDSSPRPDTIGDESLKGTQIFSVLQPMVEVNCVA